MSSPRKITAILVAKPGKAEALANLLREMTTPSRSEPGNLRWDVWLDQSDANRFVLDELFVDDNAIEAHRESPHFKRYAAQVGELAERTPITSRPFDITE